MPGGPTPIGFVVFAGIKLAGYTAAARVLKANYNRPDRSPWTVGAARTALGIVVGGTYGAVWIALAIYARLGDWSLIAWFALLFPVRMAEWFIILWFFFDRELRDRRTILRYAALGTLWSYALDVIGMLAAAVTPFGFWIC